MRGRLDLRAVTNVYHEVRKGDEEPPVVALVTDLDRTLASAEGVVSAEGRATLARARALGLRTIVASGRTHQALTRLVGGFAELDAIVAENGAIVEAPRGTSPRVYGSEGMTRLRDRLATPPAIPAELGDVIVSIPSEALDAARGRADGLAVRWIANIDRVMILPEGVTKASGVEAALASLGCAGGTFAAIGDGENDVELLTATHLSAAVANAVPALKAVAAYRCRAPGAEGIAEFLDGPVREHLDRARA